MSIDEEKKDANILKNSQKRGICASNRNALLGTISCIFIIATVVKRTDHIRGGGRGLKNYGNPITV